MANKDTDMLDFLESFRPDIVELYNGNWGLMVPADTRREDEPLYYEGATVREAIEKAMANA